MVYSCNYPIWHTFDVDDAGAIDYIILLGNTVIYTGLVYPSDLTLTTLQIDISEICKEYLETYYERMNFSTQAVTLNSLPIVGLKSTIHTFTVRSGNNPWDPSTDDNADIDYVVKYDYNTDHVSTFTDTNLLNDPILLTADPRQYIFLTGYNVNAPDTYSYSINGNAAVSRTITSYVENLFMVNLRTLGVLPGDTVRLTSTTNGLSYTYQITDGCHNRFVLYYVNKYGGLDSLLCAGKSTESFQGGATSVRLYNDRLNRRDWEQVNIYNEIDKKYKLNTLQLTDVGASKIDNLIYSPKVWLHDLDNNVINSVVITDTTYFIKNFRNNKVFNYEINVKESQKLKRR